MPGQPAGHSTRLSACWGAGHSCPLWHLPPSHRHLPGSGRRSALSPSRSLPVCNGCECSVSSLGRGALAACPHGGTRLWSGCAAALPVAACGTPVGRRRQRGMEAVRDGGGCVGTAAPAVLASAAPASRQLLATTARLNSAPHCSLASGALVRAFVGHGRPRAGPAPEKPLARGMAVPGPEALRAGRLALGHPRVPPPASPSSPIPHLAALLQVPQPLVGLGVSVCLLLLAHVRGPLLDACHEHPGEMLPPDGAALLGVGTLGLWPHKRPHGCRADPSSQWPLGTMPPRVTKAWRSPWRRLHPFEGSPLVTGTHRPTGGCGSGGTSGVL